MWREVHNLFSGLSDFGWNQATKRFEVEDELWENFIQVKSFVAKWRANVIRNYNLMEKLWSNEKATGSGQRTTWLASK
ncbi:hypothetical protein PHAVU_005G052000 [Phaseolus vulgaris]|uniref:Myb/SANT-like domain-containing protein n=1 Tax=Phaseolus vulgaris TaxID=3885 RepID=V7BTE4_PHAVU|nr:hypothetical protein PHAVU_005G052000g [Phaseolus vulgaris]ESW21219.1 hypothetical protein PHAVU_005G052000g [Phaseolus vulgaris]